MLDSLTAVYDILVLLTWNSDVNSIELLQVTPLLRGERNRARMVLEAEHEIEFGKFWRIFALDDKMMRSNSATNVYGFFSLLGWHGFSHQPSFTSDLCCSQQQISNQI